jgi:hypothetical protein
MAFTEDLTVFFNPADFAVAALYNGAITVNGIFYAEYVEALGANVVAGTGPVFQCAAADLPAIAQGDTLVIGATTYKVVGIEPDGTGLLLLKLERQ